MRTVILLSAGRHPISFRPAPVPVEAQAIRLALSLGATTGLHAGAEDAAVRDCLGLGLPEIAVLMQDANADPVPALAAALRDDPPDLVLAGRRGLGGTDSGLLPYRLARALGWPILADAASLARDGDALAVEQALARGARRRVRVRLPCLVTVHPAAPPPLPFTYAATRRGRLVTCPAAPAPHLPPAPEERLYRQRPRVIGDAPSEGGTRVLENPPPDVAAAEIIAFLRRIGMLLPRDPA